MTKRKNMRFLLVPSCNFKNDSISILHSALYESLMEGRAPTALILFNPGRDPHIYLKTNSR